MKAGFQIFCHTGGKLTKIKPTNTGGQATAYKYYARIHRVGFVCAALANRKWLVKDWHDFIFQAGFYDQAHFIKDFTEFIGRSPSTYVRDNVELANFLK